MTEIEVQNAVIVALTGDKVGKSPKGLFRFVKGIEYPAFLEILKKMCDRDEIVSRGTMLVRPQKPVDPEREALKQDILERTEALLPSPPQNVKAPMDVEQKAASGSSTKERKAHPSMDEQDAIVLEAIMNAGKPMTVKELEDITSLPATYLYHTMHRLENNSKKIRRERMPNSRQYLYSVIPPPRESAISITKGHPRLIRESLALLRRGTKCKDEEIGRIVAPEMNPEKFWDIVGNEIYDRCGGRVDDGYWLETGVQEPSVYWGDIHTNTDRPVNILSMMRRCIGYIQHQMTWMKAIVADGESLSLEEIMFQTDILNAIADGIERGESTIKIGDVQQSAYAKMEEAGEDPIFLPWWALGIFHAIGGDIDTITEEMELAEERKRDAEKEMERAKAMLGDAVRGIIAAETKQELLVQRVKEEVAALAQKFKSGDADVVGHQ